MSAVDHKSDEELLAEHLAGKAGAFDRVVARHADDLFSFFQRFVGNSSAADDLVQETFLQVHLAAGTFDPARAFKPWLYTIAANKGRDYLRARGRRPVHSLDSAGTDGDIPSPAALLEGGELAPEEELDVEQRRERVRAVIAKMPESQRLILVLGYYQKLPYAEIADILGIPVGTVKSRLHAAVCHFAKLWLTDAKASTLEH
jgi:RNA polymerase sigma-70 factor (ECF subfamily)